MHARANTVDDNTHAATARVRTPPLLDHLEHAARAHSQQLENLGLLRHGFTAHYYPLTSWELREQRRVAAAFALATNVDVFLALVRGEAVPEHRLDQTVLAAHRRRLRGS